MELGSKQKGENTVLSPEQFANRGGDLITAWAQNMEALIVYASVYEARGGEAQFSNAKHVAGEGEQLTEQQEAENAELDRLWHLALEVVTHHNDLVEWYTEPRQVRVAQNRADY